MKALSLRQPWAWLVVHGGKTIENRKWQSHYRGRFLIHAAKGMTKSEYVAVVNWLHERGLDDVARALPFPEALDRGGIVGAATLIDVVPPCRRRNVDAKELCAEELCFGHDHRWHMCEQYGFLLRDVRPLLFRPVSGALGFFGAFEEPSELWNGTIGHIDGGIHFYPEEPIE